MRSASVAVNIRHAGPIVTQWSPAVHPNRQIWIPFFNGMTGITNGLLVDSSESLGVQPRIVQESALTFARLGRLRLDAEGYGQANRLALAEY